MVAIDKSVIHAVNPAARLRNEKKYVIAAFPGPDAVPVVPLAPIEAVVVSLFNGRRTYDEIKDIAKAMAHSSSKDPDRDTGLLVDQVLSVHSKPKEAMPAPLLKPIADLSADERRSLRDYSTPEFIVPFDAYDPADTKLSYPICILWLLTNYCQVDCQYCYMDKKQIPRNDMLPFERIRELLHEGKREGLLASHASGGDPLCYPHIIDFLETLAEVSFPPIALATKSYVSPRKAARLAESASLDSLQFSIDSTVPEIADYLVQTPGFCEKTLASIHNARRAGIRELHTKTVITPYNLPTIPKLYRDMKAAGVDKIILATYCRSGYHHKPKLWNHEDDYKWLDGELEKLREEFPDDEINYQNGPPQCNPDSQEQREERWPNRSACTAGRHNFTVCANGKVVACEQMPEREEDYLGDLNVQSISEVWNDRALDAYLIHPPRERLRGTACFDCEEYEQCQTQYGICVRDSCIHYGTRWHPPSNCPKLDGATSRLT